MYIQLEYESLFSFIKSLCYKNVTFFKNVLNVLLLA